nr:TonB-dependent receptor [uncultured Gammaproteobacteria bacterium]
MQRLKPALLALGILGGTAIARETVVELTPLTVTAAHERGAGRTLLEQEVFRHSLRRTLGEALEQLPGFANQSFGPGVGLPVIRGQSGPRIRVLQNALGVNDLSQISPDHALGVEPLLAEQIEVLHGPAALRYGSGIVGGLINVLDGRIPEQRSTQPLSGQGGYQYDSTADEQAGSARLTFGWGPWVLRADGARRARGDLATGSGRLAGTDGDDRSGSVGLSWVKDWGFVGASLQRLEKTYGVSSLAEFGGDMDPEHDQNSAHGKIHIALKQNRHDFRSGIRSPWGWAEEVRLAYSHADYRHLEMEGGVRGTLWTQKSHESRLEVNHVPLGPARGSFGLQVHHAGLEARGEEAVVPRTERESYAAFVHEHLDFWPWEMDLGARVEHLQTQAQGFGLRRDLPVSGAASLSFNAAEHHRLTLAFTSTQRPPAPQELYSFGVHQASQAFEIGDPGLNLEHSNLLELGYRFEHPKLTAEVNVFHYWVGNFIFFRNTGRKDEESGLPVLTAAQQDAIFKGFEAKLDFPLLATAYGELDLILFSDYTRARFQDGSDVPRMPPWRYGFEVKWRAERGEVFLRLTRAEPQDHPGAGEAPTPSYVLLNLGGEYRLPTHERLELALFARATNLLDQTVRNSTSFLRTVAPEPGRGAQVGVRVGF